MKKCEEAVTKKRERIIQICEPLIKWYQGNAKQLPWRVNPTPYGVWISEIMLQQTRIEAVKPYYERFIRALPAISALAAAEEETVLKLWEGLGYYSRARNLQKAAVFCVEHYAGELPQSYEALIALPGIGSYTAGAIASIAFRLPAPAVDGNVLRVISRLCEDGEDIAKPSVKTDTEKLLWQIMPKNAPGAFNEGIMELGETICMPGGAPRCGICPLRAHCLAGRNGTAGQYPVKSVKKPRRIEARTIFLLEAGERVAIRKRPDKGLLAGLYELPAEEGHWSREEVERWLEQRHAEAAELEFLTKAKHIFSHIEWHMTGYRIRMQEELAGDWIYVSREALQTVYPLPTAYQAYAAYLR